MLGAADVTSTEWAVSQLVYTGAGMFGLWQPERFDAVASLDEWEDQVADDTALSAHILEGAFVPINILADGAFQIAVRGGRGANDLSERERRVRLVSSDAYLLVSKGRVLLGGIEAVGRYSGAPSVPIYLPTGRYSVRIHLIDWKAELGAAGPDGHPTESALSDFVVQISPESGRGPFRTNTVTFDRP
jgi:hypothetical protein